MTTTPATPRTRSMTTWPSSRKDLVGLPRSSCSRVASIFTPTNQEQVRGGHCHRNAAMKLVVGVVVAAALGFAICRWVSQAGAMDCNGIQTAYASALLHAQACDLAVPDSCGATRPRAPQDVCRCQVAVNPVGAEELD